MGNDASKPAKKSGGGAGAKKSASSSSAAAATKRKSNAIAKKGSATGFSQPEPEYETETAASLVDGGKNLPAFHGLLVGRTKPLLQYEQPGDGAPGVTAAVYPDDDSVPSRGGQGLITISDVVMTLRYTVIVAADAKEEEGIRETIKKVFDTINTVANGWASDSEISEFNNAKPEKSIKLSDTLARLFDIVDELHDLSDARFDPTTGVIKQAYQEALHGSGRPPKPTEMRPYKFATGWTKRMKRKGTAVTKNNANTIIDLDGVSKGFAVDLITESLQSAGYTNFYVDWAGDIRVMGKHPSGRSWRTAVVNPPELQRLFGAWKEKKLDQMLTKDDVGYLVDLDEGKGVAMATSGDYFQIKKYGFHHIMSVENVAALKASPRTPGSISVMASSCALADGIATAAMTFGSPVEAAAFLKAIMKKFPTKVFGFCVVGRGPRAHHENHFTSQFVSTGQGAVKTTAEARESSSAGVSSAVNENVLKLLTRIPGVLSCDGGKSMVDTLVSCSIDIDAIVTFFVSKGSVTKGAEAKFEFTATDKKKPIEFKLSIEDVYPIGKEELAVAKIEEIQYGSSNTVAYIAKGEQKGMNWRTTIARGDLSAQDLENQAKEIFSDLPYSVCVVTAVAADGKEYGLTVTSLTYSKGVFCFNVMESSTFGTAFAGEGAEVNVYVLNKGMGQIADDVRKTALILKSGKEKLDGGSMAMFKGVAARVETVHDHAVVLLELTSLDKFEEATALQWHRRNYL